MIDRCKNLRVHVSGPVLTFFVALITVISLSTFISPTSTYADDLNSYTIKGDVFALEIIRNASNGSYVHSLLFVWSDDPVQPLQPIMLRCDADKGGSLQNCLFPFAFLNCTRTRTDSINPFNGEVTERYTCTPPARRDAGECVNLLSYARPMDGFVYGISDAGDGGKFRSAQVLSLEVIDVAYVTGCKSKP